MSNDYNFLQVFCKVSLEANLDVKESIRFLEFKTDISKEKLEVVESLLNDHKKLEINEKNIHEFNKKLSRFF